MREDIIKSNLARYLSIKKWSYALQIIIIGAILYFGYNKATFGQDISIYSLIGLGIIAFISLGLYIYKDLKLKKNVEEKNLSAIVIDFSMQNVNQLFRRPRLKIHELNKSYEIIFGIEIEKLEGKKVTVVYDEATKMILDIY